MSISILLLPLVIAFEAGVSIIAGMTEIATENETLSPIETIFNDITLLEKTLKEHGLTVSVVSDNQLACWVGDALFDYTRQKDDEPFTLTVSGLQITDSFLKEIECFECEYKQNVQSYTYNKLIENLSANNMRVVEETVLEDNSILLTIDI